MAVDCCAGVGESHGRCGLRFLSAFPNAAERVRKGRVQPREHTAASVRVHSERRTGMATTPDQGQHGAVHHDKALDGRPRTSDGVPNRAIVPVARNMPIDSTGEKVLRGSAQCGVIDVVFGAASAH